MHIDKDLFVKIVDSLHDGLYIVDRDRKISYWNRAAEQISGFKADEVVGLHCSDNILTHVDSEGKQLCLDGCPLEKVIQDGKPREVEIYMHHKDGHRVPVSVRVSSLTDHTGKIIGGIELFTDISNQNANSLRVKELEKLALLDPLTQLANRSYMDKMIQIRLEEKKRLKVPFGLFFIDIDFFKNINDEYGHDAGDRVLRYIARTFAVHSRPFDVYGRWGGEEFVGIIRNITVQDLEAFGNRLRMLIERSYISNEGNRLHVTVSIGATMVKDDDIVETLIKRADTLMYESKKAGRNRLTLG
ncbi:MAG: sensor domain-containing diguanylate cyclase [Deltaproteobacteria bacterium]|nr:sensor domain-containing diguanylate cyclase [Deltaproteobacteria bacterium]